MHAGFFAPCGICDVIKPRLRPYPRSSLRSRTTEKLRNVTNPRRVCVRRREKNSIIFSGGVYGGENTARLANMRIGRLWCTMRALQRAAISSTEGPAKRSSVERVPKPCLHRQLRSSRRSQTIKKFRNVTKPRCRSSGVSIYAICAKLRRYACRAPENRSACSGADAPRSRSACSPG